MMHSLGLAIVLPHYLEYCLNEQNAPLYREFAVNVLGVDAGLSPVRAAEEGISILRKIFFEICGLKSRLRDCGVQDDSRFVEMARIACRGDILHGLIDLTREDVVAIYKKSF